MVISNQITITSTPVKIFTAVKDDTVIHISTISGSVHIFLGPTNAVTINNGFLIFSPAELTLFKTGNELWAVSMLPVVISVLITYKE